MKTIIGTFLILLNVALAQSQGVEDFVKTFAIDIFSTPGIGRMDANPKGITYTEIKNENYAKTYKLSYVDNSDMYYATIHLNKNEEGKLEIVDCISPRYLSEWRNGEVCEAQNSTYKSKKSGVKKSKTACKAALDTNQKYLVESTLSGDIITGPDGKVYKLVNEATQGIVNGARAGAEKVIKSLQKSSILKKEVKKNQ